MSTRRKLFELYNEDSDFIGFSIRIRENKVDDEPWEIYLCKSEFYRYRKLNREGGYGPDLIFCVVKDIVDNETIGEQK